MLSLKRFTRWTSWSDTRHGTRATHWTCLWIVRRLLSSTVIRTSCGIFAVSCRRLKLYSLSIETHRSGDTCCRKIVQLISLLTLNNSVFRNGDLLGLCYLLLAINLFWHIVISVYICSYNLFCPYDDHCSLLGHGCTIRYDSVYLTCSKKLTGSQLSPPHGTNKKLKCETKNKVMWNKVCVAWGDYCV